jgi:trehalose-phosphatase
MTQLTTPQALADRIRAAGTQWFWLVDYDGTLVGIVQDPNEAKLSIHGQVLLAQLSQQAGHRLSLVSGRSVSQLQGFLPVLTSYPVLCSGLHGGELMDWGSGQWLATPPEHLQTGVQAFHQALETELAPFQGKGMLLEDKTYSLAVHTRQLDPAMAEACEQAVETVYAALPSLHEDFRLMHGKRIRELLPRAFDKGRAIRQILSLPEAEGYYPIYLGDDITDEDAFAAIQNHGGLAVLVGAVDRESRAQVMLEDELAVFQLFSLML